MKELSPTPDLKPLLDHARGQFQYHAKQRLDSIRYFLAGYGVFAARYLSLLKNFSAAPLTAPSLEEKIGPAVLSASLFIITLVFWGLDFRNAQMVKIDEAAIKGLEKAASDTYGLTDFEMAEAWELPKQKLRKYQFLVNVLFIYLGIVSAAVATRDIYKALLIL